MLREVHSDNPGTHGQALFSDDGPCPPHRLGGQPGELHLVIALSAGLEGVLAHPVRCRPAEGR